LEYSIKGLCPPTSTSQREKYGTGCVDILTATLALFVSRVNTQPKLPFPLTYVPENFQENLLLDIIFIAQN